jgi:hypothetical protein
MALSAIRTYFKDRIAAVDADFKEWTDAFNIENIPATFYDKSYHISYGQMFGDILGGKSQKATMPVILRAGFKGFRDVSASLDAALDLMQEIIEEIQDPVNRLGADIKNVKFITMNDDPGFTTNDNLILVTQNYEVTLFLC